MDPQPYVGNQETCQRYSIKVINKKHVVDQNQALYLSIPLSLGTPLQPLGKILIHLLLNKVIFRKYFLNF